MLHLPILLGAEVVMLPKFTMTAMLDAIVRYQLRELILVPPLLIRLVRDPIIARYDLSCIRRFSSGSAPLPREVIQLLQKKFPQTGFKQGYGMTESTSCLTAHSPEHYEWSNAETVGTIVPSTQIKIVDERNNEVDEGEILAKGPQCAMGYLGNAQATKEAFDPDGWLRTGDKGKIDSNGLVRITGRLKDIIKVKGIAISPAELEDVLMAHPKVLDAAVVGVPDSYSGERPKAYVVVGPGVAVGNDVKEELLGLVREKKDRNKWLAGLEFIDAVPKAPSGKILRRELRDRASLVTRVAKL
jgi:acyl-CoA synthetase (AMP-forming)/AMP-acid ligase II